MNTLASATLWFTRRNSTAKNMAKDCCHWKSLLKSTSLQTNGTQTCRRMTFLTLFLRFILHRCLAPRCIARCVLQSIRRTPAAAHQYVSTRFAVAAERTVMHCERLLPRRSLLDAAVMLTMGHECRQSDCALHSVRQAVRSYASCNEYREYNARSYPIAAVVVPTHWRASCG